MKVRKMDRRQFARLFTLGGSAAILSRESLLASPPPKVEHNFKTAGIVDWDAVRSQFMMPPELSVLNAANHRNLGECSLKIPYLK